MNNFLILFIYVWLKRIKLYIEILHQAKGKIQNQNREWMMFQFQESFPFRS